MNSRIRIAVTASLFAAGLGPQPLAQTRDTPSSPIVGAWTLNQELSDKPPAQPETGRSGGPGGGRGGGGGGGRGGGGFGGGFGRGGGASGRGGGMSQEDMQRMRDAMRDIMTAAEHLTIVQTGTMVIVTTGDGRTTRLSADAKSIKDDSTGIERKTKWQAEKLVSEISGAGRGGKIIEEYSVDPETDRLQIRLTLPDIFGGRGGGASANRIVNRVYDPEAR